MASIKDDLKSASKSPCLDWSPLQSIFQFAIDLERSQQAGLVRCFRYRVVIVIPRLA